MENIQKNTASAEATETTDNKQTSSKDSSTKDSSGKKVIIKKLSIRNGEITIAASAVSDLTKATLHLPDITLTNIGEEKKGASITGTISKVLTKIADTAYKTVIDSNITDLKNVAKENLDNVVGGVKDRIKEIGIFGK